MKFNVRTIAFLLALIPNLLYGQQAFQLSDTVTLRARMNAAIAETAAGQSNMKFTLDHTRNALKEIFDEMEVMADDIENEKSVEYSTLSRLIIENLSIQIVLSREPSNQSVENIISLLSRLEYYKPNPQFLGSHLQIVAQILHDKGAYKEAVNFYNRAITILFNQQDINGLSLQYLYLSILDLHLKLEAPYLAKNVIAHLNDYYKSDDKTDHSTLAFQILQFYKARYYMMIGAPKEALNTFKLIELDKTQFDNVFEPHFTYANVLLVNAMPDSAFNVVNHMYELPSRGIANTNLRRLAAAQIHLSKNNIDKALTYLDSLDGWQFKHHQKQSLLYNVRIQAYQRSDQPARALNAYEALKSYSDSVKTILSLTRAEVLNNAILKEGLKADMVRQNMLDQESQKRKTLIFGGLSLLALLIVIAWFRVNTLRKRVKLETELQKSREVAKMKSNFLNNLSHEIRTPLTVISGYIDLLSQNIFHKENAAKYIDRAMKSSNALVNNLNNHLLLSRLEDPLNDNTIETEKPLKEFISSLVESFEAVVAQKQQQLYYKTNIRDGISVKYAYDHLDKTITNLLNNSVKYTPTQKSIYVSAMMADHYLIITVKDEGSGMDQEEVKSIFDRFYQSQRNQHIGGFGIGLALVKELVERLNGTINVKSALGLGTSMEIKLPLEPQAGEFYIQENYEDVFKCLANSEEETTSARNEQNQPSLLVVDDNVELMSYLRELFNDKFDCHYAFNGQEALKLALSTKFDIIISDMKMPVMGGIELFKELRKLENYESTPFIILSASFTEQPQDYIATVGITDYILKPFTPSELMARINFLLQNKMYQKQLHDTEAVKVDFDGKYAELMQQLNEVIIENLDNPDFGVKELVKTSGYSQSRLHQILSTTIGLSPVKIILEIRLLKAYEFIAQSKYQTVSEVCYAVGFSSKSYFFKKFKERFGITAGDFMKKHANVLT